MKSVHDEMITYQKRQARRDALEAGSAISTCPDDAAMVLANTQPILEFLLGGDLEDDHDLAARRRAVRRHLDNTRGPGHRTDDPEAFLVQARLYYQFLAPPPPSPEAPVHGTW